MKPEKNGKIEPYIIISDNEQYNIWDINQTNNPHVFELRTLKVSREPYIPFSYTFFNTVEKKSQEVKYMTLTIIIMLTLSEAEFGIRLT
jgi:hypothetical protein